MIQYRVELIDFTSHLFKVSLIIPKPLITQILIMPCWIPGSYVIRDFAKQLSNITISQDNAVVDFCQTKSHEWVVETTNTTPLTITYLIYAFDKSVRGAFLDTQRGFFNATSLCLCPIGFEHERYQLDIVDPKRDWQLVTGLACAEGTNRYEFGLYEAKNYAQLIDCPVLMGKLIIRTFMIQHVTHDIAISGDPEGDIDLLAQDVQKICQSQLALFKTFPSEINYYCFLLHVTNEGYGGIEHVNSCSLLINKFAIMPAKKNQTNTDLNVYPKVYPKSYIDLLGLFSHEYFHLWMVKQIKPKVFLSYDLTQPNYTTQLWAFEGFTAYYDDLMLARAGLITLEQYWVILAENISKLLKTPGRKHQSVKSASFDAWIKFYKPDDNSINSTVSYYLKGALLALCCDLQLRLASNHEDNLDEIMAALWQQYGQIGRGVEEGEIEKIIGQYNNDIAQNLLSNGLDTTNELPIEAILKAFGLEINNMSNNNGQMLDFGAKLIDFHTMVCCQEIYQDGMLRILGVQSGDILVACQEHRITYQNYQILFQRYLNQTVHLRVFREDKLILLSGVITPHYVQSLDIKLIPGFEHNINKWILVK